MAARNTNSDRDDTDREISHVPNDGEQSHSETRFRRLSATAPKSRYLGRRACARTPGFRDLDIADLVSRNGGTYAYKLLECRKLGPDPERRELLGVSLRTPVLWMRCMHLSDGTPIQLEERLININAAPNITCQPLETQGPGSWLLAQVPWTDAEHKISAREAPPEVAVEAASQGRHGVFGR